MGTRSIRVYGLQARSRLLRSCASVALLVLPVATLGVTRPAEAQTTINTSTTTTVNLASYGTGNPFTIESGVTINTTSPPGSGGSAVYGDTTRTWSLTNNGTVIGAAGVEAVNLKGPALNTVTNAGSISGVVTGIMATQALVSNQTGATVAGGEVGILISNGGTISNNGSITSSGKIPVPVPHVVNYLGTGIYAPSGGVVSNTGSIYGGFVGAFGRSSGGLTVTNSGGISGGEQGVSVRNGALSLTNQASGVVTGSSAAVFLSAGTGTITNSGTFGSRISFDGLATADSSLILNNQRGGLLRGTYDGLYLNGTSTVTNSGSIFGGQNGVDARRGNSFFTNNGTISSNFFGVSDAASQGSIFVNGPGAVITGGFAGFYLGGAGTLTNAGTIIARSFYGVGVSLLSTFPITNSGLVSGNAYGVYAAFRRVAEPTTVTNSAGGLITGGGAGIFFPLAAGTVVNAGTVTSPGTYTTGTQVPDHGTGIAFAKGGTVTNTGAIYGREDGVHSNSNNLTLTNSGSIIGKTVYGIATFDAPASITNQQGGVISGNNIAVFLSAGGTLTNAGSIVTTVGRAVVAGGSLSVSNLAGGSITGSELGIEADAGANITNAGVIAGAAEGILANGNGTSTVTNSGSIVGTHGFGLAISSAAFVTNQQGGLISGALSGIGVLGTGTVSNAGTVIVTGANGVPGGVAGLGTPVTNAPAPSGLLGSAVYVGDGGAVTNAGSILGSVRGVVMAGNAGIANQAGGAISGGAAGVFLSSSGTVINAGRIVSSGVYQPVRIAGLAGFSGTITNARAPQFQRPGIGVYLAAGGTIGNTGTIFGANAGILSLAGGTSITNSGSIGASVGKPAIMFGTGANLLLLQTGSTLGGEAIGGTGAGTSNSLMLEGVGTENHNFVNFRTLTVSASGVWTLNGVSSIPTVTVTSGTLEVGDAAHTSASLTGNFSVTAGGVLAGHGNIVGNVTNAGGTIRPGGSIGALTINGNFTQTAAGVFAVEVNPGAASPLAVNGNATIAGALEVLPDVGSYVPGTNYKVLTATGGVSGTFSPLSNLGASNLIFEQVDLANEVDLLFAGFDFVPAATTPNQSAVATTLNAIETAGIPPGFGPVLDSAGNLPLAQQPHALDLLGGQVYADFLISERDAFRNFLAGMNAAAAGDGNDASAQSASLTQLSPRDGTPLTVWGHAFGHFTSIDGNVNASGVDASSGGAVLGIERRLDTDGIAGVAAQYSHTSLSLDTLPQTGTLDQMAVGLYGEQCFGLLFLDGAGALAYQHGAASRTLAISGLANAQGSFDGFAGGFEARTGLRTMFSDSVLLEPSAALTYTHVVSGGFTESGGGGGALSLGAQSRDELRGTLGVRLKETFASDEGLWKPEASVAWSHDFTSPTPNVTEAFALAPQNSFVITGANPGRDAALVGAGISFAPAANWSLFARYDGTLGTHETDHAVTVGFKMTW